MAMLPAVVAAAASSYFTRLAVWRVQFWMVEAYETRFIPRRCADSGA